MAKYAEKLPVMKAEAIASPVAQAAGPEALAAVASARMRCSGCGAKVGSSVLSRALKRLSTPEHEHVLVGLGSPDDAALIQPPPPGHALVQTVDFLRSFVDDPLVFGAIAANHSLGDCHAMGATAQTALAVAVVPHGLDAQVEEDLYQMLAGALPVLSAAGCALVGGHTSEGAELALGFAINGSVQPEKALRKMGLQPGQILVLTKPLGTGMLLAAHMRRLAKGRWLQGAIDTMRQSNEAAAGCLQQHGASACTDVTGFGLLGHILEMAQASQVQVEVQAANLPILEGIQQCLQAGVTSSLHAQNSRIVSAMADVEQAAQHALWPLLCDPQTGGGLLAGVHPEQAEECISQLHLLGYGHACIVGIVQQSHDQQITTPFVALAGSGNLFRP